LKIFGCAYESPHRNKIHAKAQIKERIVPGAILKIITGITFL